jgi:membrane protease subunit (stomatin/prohibitin family)
VKQIEPTWREAKAATLRVRYAELLRFREYVQRQEALCQDGAERRKETWTGSRPARTYLAVCGQRGANACPNFSREEARRCDDSGRSPR